MTDIRRTVEVLLTVPLTGRGVSYTFGELAATMADSHLALRVHTPRSRGRTPRGIKVSQSLPPLIRELPYRRLAGRGRATARRSFLAAAAAADAAWVWVDYDPFVVEALAALGTTVVREKVNCGRAVSRAILDRAYDAAGVSPRHGFDDEAVRLEREALAATDLIFCPSPLVEASLLADGVDPGKLIATSYGWSPDRLGGTRALLSPVEGPTFLFVGRIGLRKGAHLLLRAWAGSGVRGRLVLAGKLDPDLADLCRKELDRPDVLVLDYVKDVGSLYRSADVFVFPSLEEGGPQVTYEAQGCGLPVLVSPMGAGRITRDGLDGYVAEADDHDAWVHHLQVLASGPELRNHLGGNAFQHAQHYTWTKVGASRRHLLHEALAGST